MSIAKKRAKATSPKTPKRSTKATSVTVNPMNADEREEARRHMFIYDMVAGIVSGPDDWNALLEQLDEAQREDLETDVACLCLNVQELVKRHLPLITRHFTKELPVAKAPEKESLASRFDEEKGDFAATLSLLPGRKGLFSYLADTLVDLVSRCSVGEMGKKDILQFIEDADDPTSHKLYVRVFAAHQLFDAMSNTCRVVGMTPPHAMEILDAALYAGADQIGRDVFGWHDEEEAA